jgi:hypothetical protein
VLNQSIFDVDDAKAYSVGGEMEAKITAHTTRGEIVYKDTIERVNLH